MVADRAARGAARGMRRAEYAGAGVQIVAAGMGAAARRGAGADFGADGAEQV